MFRVYYPLILVSSNVINYILTIGVHCVLLPLRTGQSFSQQAMRCFVLSSTNAVMPMWLWIHSSCLTWSLLVSWHRALLSLPSSAMLSPRLILPSVLFSSHQHIDWRYAINRNHGHQRPVMTWAPQRSTDDTSVVSAAAAAAIADLCAQHNGLETPYLTDLFRLNP